MKKEKIKSLVQVLIPLFLLCIFAFFVYFPTLVPFSGIQVRSQAGLGTVSFEVTGNGKDALSFAMKQVPSGTAPSLCTDLPGGTVVDRPYLLGETEVTRSLWAAVHDRAVRAGSVFSSQSPVEHKKSEAQWPMEAVSWRDAVVWCNALSSELSLSPVYFNDESFLDPVKSVGILAETEDRVFIDPEADGFRLPSSAEWELAARYIDGISWTSGGNPSGSAHAYFDGSYAADYAVFAQDVPEPVKSRASNALGIYDMSGNVWEWCFDRFADKRVVRGGGWVGTSYRLQIGGTFGTLSGALERGQGFRPAKNR